MTLQQFTSIKVEVKVARISSRVRNLDTSNMGHQAARSSPSRAPLDLELDRFISKLPALHHLQTPTYHHLQPPRRSALYIQPIMSNIHAMSDDQVSSVVPALLVLGLRSIYFPRLQGS